MSPNIPNCNPNSYTPRVDFVIQIHGMFQGVNKLTSFHQVPSYSWTFNLLDWNKILEGTSGMK